VFGVIVSYLLFRRATISVTRTSTDKKRRQHKATLAESVRANKTTGPGQPATATDTPTQLPNREALIARLEAQRTELLRAMSCVSLARRTIEEHAAYQPQNHIPVDPKEHEFYRQRVLAALHDARDALGTAYPMLERIAQALDVEKILAHPPEREPSRAHAAVRLSRKEPRRSVLG
jgi:hypothetical protein